MGERLQLNSTSSPAPGGPARVLFVDHETRLSGGQRDLVDLITALRPFGLTSHVALPGDGPLARACLASGARVHLYQMSSSLRETSRWELGGRPSGSAARALESAAVGRRIGRLIDIIRPDVVHTNSMKAHLIAIPACRSRGVPLVWHVRDILSEGWLRKAFDQGGARGADLVACISEAVKAQFGWAAHKARVVYNGIELSSFEAGAGDRLRDRIGLGPGARLVGIVGQIAYWKGQDLFLEAAAKVAAADPQVHIAIIGRCLFPENEAAFEAQIRRQADHLALGDRIHWVDWVDRPEEAMDALDVAVHSSRLPEPFGRVIVEAMAAGTPIVASARGAGPELVSGPGAAVVDPEDTGAVAAAIASLLQTGAEPAVKASVAQQAKRFDISNTAAGVLGLYRELGLAIA